MGNRREDSVSSLRRKAEYLISVLLRSSVFRGSDSPPDCHSLPLPFESSSIYIPAKRKSPRKTWTLSFWQGREDSNPRPTVLETGTLPTELHPCALKYYITLFFILQVFFEKSCIIFYFFFYFISFFHLLSYFY